MLADIAKNDYNLNIPRYVDTFEEVASIDIDFIANQLQDLDLEITKTDKIIKEFCNQLNITPPF